MIWYPVAFVAFKGYLETSIRTIPLNHSNELYSSLIKGFVHDKDSFQTGLLPVDSLSLKRNTYSKADELTVTVSSSYVDFDPRIFRSLVVEAYIASVPGDVYAKGPSEIRKYAAKRRNIRFLGVVDTISKVEDDGGVKYDFRARDYTALFADYHVLPEDVRNVNWHKPFIQVIADIVKRLAAVRNIKIWAVGEAGSLLNQKIRMPSWSKLVPIKYAGQTFWDMIQDLTLRMGMVSFVDLDRLVFALPSTMYEAGQSIVNYGVLGSPGQRNIIHTTSFISKKRPHPWGRGYCHIPAWVFGANIASLEISREYGRLAIPTVEVRSLTPEGVKVGRWPENGQDKVIRRYVIAGLSSDEQCKNVAKEVWEQLARNQVRVRVSTMDLGSWGATQEDADALEYRAGMPIEVLPTRSDVTVQELIKAGMKKEKAVEIANLLKSRRLQTVWYLGEVSYDWSATEGLRITMDLASYLKVDVSKVFAQKEEEVSFA